MNEIALNLLFHLLVLIITEVLVLKSKFGNCSQKKNMNFPFAKNSVVSFHYYFGKIPKVDLVNSLFYF